jgi:beta-galactosidase GanA
MGTKKGKSAGDPWCIGYFSDNEMSWGDEVSLAIAALQSSPSQAAKQAFVADLKAKYSTIARLNEAWGATHASWEALLESRQAPDKEKARADLTVFYTKVAERYFQTVREAIKSVAPNQLYLGCRFAAVNSRAAAAAAKYCDVVSYNLYQRSVADFQFNGGADVPLLIGEFHFGALDRGLFHTGLVPVADQAARAQAYKDYVQGAVRHPQFVGCHWFQYQDEPTIGRVYDEENYQIGFVDVADTPYAETIAAAREVGGKLYR